MCERKSIKAWLLALGFNLLVLTVLLLLFEPTPKSDDYDVAMILYGGYTGEYSPYMLYSNILFGKAIQGLMFLWPTVSWYYMLQYVGMVIAFSTITYVFIEKSNGHKWVFPCLMFLMFCGYECFIRITFTKSAGILIMAGFLLILYRIESKESFGQSYFCGIGLIFCGMLIRLSMYKLIAALFVSSFVIFLLENRKIERGQLKKWIIYFIAITVGLWLTGNALEMLNKWQMAQDAEWKVFSEVNRKRAALNDYGWPEYERFEGEYTQLGVSANDIEMWRRYGNINDTEVLSPELMDGIRTRIPIDQGASLYQKLAAASKGLLAYYFNDTGIYLFLLCAICLGLFQEKRTHLRIKIGLVSGCCIFAYYYMYYLGRLQHHVDVIVLITGAVLFLYYLFPTSLNRDRQKHMYTITVLIAVTFISKFYVSLSTSSYYGASFGNITSQREQFAENRELLSLLSEDEKHLYLFSAYETNWIYDAAWSVTEVVSPGFYHNLCMMNRYEIPDNDRTLKNYDIKNAYKEITDSSVIYFVDTGHLPGQIETLCQYIREHYCPKTNYTLVKRLNGLNIYRFTKGEITPEWAAGEIKFSAEVQADIQAVIKDDTLHVNGYAFIDGIDSYSQNIYLCMQEHGKEDAVYKYAVQMENEQFADQDKYHGKYSAFIGEYTLEENVAVKDISLMVYLDTGDDVYYLPVTLSEK